MSISTEIATRLQEEHGFDAPDNEGNLFKELLKGKVWLYFGKESDEGGPWLGFWIEESVGKTLRDSIAEDLLDLYDDDMMDEINLGILYADDGPMIYYDIISSSYSVVDWVTSVLFDLELKADFAILEYKAELAFGDNIDSC